MADPGRRTDDVALAQSARPTAAGADPTEDVAPPLIDGPASGGGARESAARPPSVGAGRVLSGRGWTVTAVVADVLMLVLAVVAALIGANAAHVHAVAPELAWTSPPLVVGLLAIRGLYRRKIAIQYLDEVGHVVGACSVAAMVNIALVAFTGGAAGQAELLARVWAFAMVYLAGSRYVLGATQRRARQERIVAQRTLIVGAGHIGAQLERRLDEHP